MATDRRAHAAGLWALLAGEHRSVALLASEYLTEAAETPVDVGAPAAVAGLERHFEERRLVELGRRLDRLAVLGPPPWEDERFQVFAVVDPASPMWKFGSDFIPTASPTASAEWYCRGLDADRAAARAEIVATLEEFERASRARQNAILERLRAAGGSQEPEPDAVAYVIVGRRCFVFRRGESVRLESAIARAQGNWEQAVTEAVDLLRRGG